MRTTKGHLASICAANFGFKTILLHGITENNTCTCNRKKCEHFGKHPIKKGFFDDATTDIKTLEQWFEEYPFANTGIATGNGLFVLDIDSYRGGDESIEKLEEENGKLPNTVEVLTGGGGRHIFYYSSALIGNSTNIRPGLDIRSDGGYVVAPPSKHKSGRNYEWEISSHPEDTEIAQAPDWLIEIISKKRFKPSKDMVKIKVNQTLSQEQKIYCKKALEKSVMKIKSTVKGERNKTLNSEAYSLGGFVVIGGLDEEEVIDSLLTAALENGSPEAESLRTIFSGIQAGYGRARKLPKLRMSFEHPPI